MSTDTDPILAALARQRDEHAAAGQLAEVQRVDQQVIAVQTLARLDAERAAAEEAGAADAVAAIDAQGRFWARQVDLAALAEAAAAGEHVGADARRRAPLATLPAEEEDSPGLPGGAAKSKGR
ncbi:hypothetical protein [Micromonospora aurantiaca (nom. illeg.)]|uniref:hypothetical protein n=1 Tax=Micromonospora aurantiaca (nom. illeg.) TaxID=47850 RepID=UPI0016574BFD|nr:hypothetical protein [Micromonospora aurantiaca]MBC9001289.1 hypothetical protein [Micromonospora aurantiaca]